MKELKLYNGKIRIDFDPDNHRFYHKDGRPILSVTTITRIIDKSRPLIIWASNLTGDYVLANLKPGKITASELEKVVREAKRQHSVVKEAEANIGTEIHKWISEWIKGEKPEIPDDEKVKNGIIAFMDFQRQHKAKWLESEKIVYSRKYDYAGVLDAIAKIDGKLVLVDFKSTNGLYPEFAFQTAGYQLAYEEEKKKKLAYRLIIGFGKNTGEFQLKEYKENKPDKETFLSCLQLKRRLKEIT